MTYADIRNKTTFLKILEERRFESLAISFFQSFLGINAVRVSGNSYASTIFIAKGAFNDDHEFVITDDVGIKHLIHIRFFELHLGITDGYFEIENYKWRDLKMHAQTQGFNHSFCQNVRELCFFFFDFSHHSVFHSVRQYDFDEMPFVLRFDCYELNKFEVSKELSEKEIWLHIIKFGFESASKFPQTPFLRLLKKAFDMRKWDETDIMFYESRQKYKNERHSSILQKYREQKIELDSNFLEKSAHKATWNWGLMEKQLDKLPKNKIIPSAIDIQSLAIDLSRFTFDLFKKWTKKCQKIYPSIDLTIIDERLLVADVEKQIRESLIAVFDDETFYRRGMSKTYATDFFIVYLEASLSRSWYTEYIIKTRSEFKTIMALRSLKIFLDLEDVMRIKLEDIYSEVMKDKVNLSNLDIGISKIDLKSNNGDKIVEANEATTNVQTVIVNLTNEYIQKVSKIQVENYNLNLAEHIEDSVVTKFIESNWVLFLH